MVGKFSREKSRLVKWIIIIEVRENKIEMRRKKRYMKEWMYCFFKKRGISQISWSYKVCFGPYLTERSIKELTTRDLRTHQLILLEFLY